MWLCVNVFAYTTANLWLFCLTSANDIYRIEPCPFGTSTVHVKSFSSSISSVIFVNKFIISNQDRAVWTLWPSPHNESQIPRPFYTFNEHCTINVVVEMPSPNSKDLKSMARYMRNTTFPFRAGYSHSIFIQIKFKCDYRVGDQSLTLPLSLFLYFVDCPTVNDLKARFPHVYVSPYCGAGFRNKMLNNSLSTYGGETLVKYKDECWKEDLGFLSQRPILVEKNNWPQKANCLQTRWKADDISADLVYCQMTDFLMIHVVHGLRLNYTYDKDIKLRKYPSVEKTRGWFFLDNFFGGNGKGKIYDLILDHYTGRFYLDISRSHFIWCDFTIPKEEDMSFLAWFSPFRVEVWLGFLACIIGISLCLALKDITADRLQNNLSFVEYATSMCRGLFIIVRIILRQNVDMLSTIMLIFSFATMVITSLFENTVTSDLIVPVLPNIMKDVSDLYRNGYLIFKYDNNVKHSADGPSFVSRSTEKGSSEFGFLPPQYIVYPTSTFGIQDYQKVYNNRERKLAEHVVGTESEAQWMLHDISRYSKYPCHRTLQPEGFYLQYMQVVGFFEKEATRLVSLYSSAGFLAFWQRHDEFVSYLVFLRSSAFREKYVNKNQSNLLTLYNLVPVFCVWIGLCVASVIGFLVEVCTSVRIAIKFNFIIKFTPKANAPRQVNQQILVRTCIESD
jgi:hypothetical protein